MEYRDIKLGCIPLCFVLVLSTSCGFNDKPGGNDPCIILTEYSLPLNQSKNFFVKEVHPLFQQTCVNCHTAQGSRASEPFADPNIDLSLRSAKQFTNFTNISRSRLIERLVERHNCGFECDSLKTSLTQAIQGWADDQKEVVQSPNCIIPPAPPITRFPISQEESLFLVLRDVGGLSNGDKPFIRYISLGHYYNARSRDDFVFSDVQLSMFSKGLSKWVNSLSWSPKLTAPVEVLGSRGTLFRIDLRDYSSSVGTSARNGFSAEDWDNIATQNIYPPASSTELENALQTKSPILRGDVLVVLSTRPSAYHDILGIPIDVQVLESNFLGIDVAANITNRNILRSGFSDSGVSQNHRIIERHDVANYSGSYWKSYDFADTSGAKNIFTNPMGPNLLPEFAGDGFDHDGGEVIFTLPNGLQGYMLIDRNGARIEEAPVAIVQDPVRTVVSNGISCMYCHRNGVIEKLDQIQLRVELAPSEFTQFEIDFVGLAHPSTDQSQLNLAFQTDMARFRESERTLGSQGTPREPISGLFEQYTDVPINAAIAAAETGLELAEFNLRLKSSPAALLQLGNLLNDGGTVKRDVFESVFPTLLREFGL